MKLTKQLRITIATTAILTTVFTTYAGVQAVNGRSIIPTEPSAQPVGVWIQEAPKPSESPDPVVQELAPATDVETQDKPSEAVGAAPAPSATPKPRPQYVVHQEVSAGAPEPISASPTPSTAPYVSADASINTFD